MNVTVRYHALLREKTGREEEAYPLAEDARVATALALFRERYPALAALAGRCHVAVNDEFAQEVDPLHEGDRIDLLPPFGGG